MQQVAVTQLSFCVAINTVKFWTSGVIQIANREWLSRSQWGKNPFGELKDGDNNITTTSIRRGLVNRISYLTKHTRASMIVCKMAKEPEPKIKDPRKD